MNSIHKDKTKAAINNPKQIKMLINRRKNNRTIHNKNFEK